MSTLIPRLKNLFNLTPIKRRITIQRNAQTHLQGAGWQRTGGSDPRLEGYYRRV